jgi:hypothetical protein
MKMRPWLLAIAVALLGLVCLPVDTAADCNGMLCDVSYSETPDGLITPCEVVCYAKIVHRWTFFGCIFLEGGPTNCTYPETRASVIVNTYSCPGACVLTGTIVDEFDDYACHQTDCE